jgi:hypothetical protein
LKVQLDAVAAYASISRVVGIVPEHHFKTELRVEADGRLYIA